jgi:hypothetical protein
VVNFEAQFSKKQISSQNTQLHKLSAHQEKEWNTTKLIVAPSQCEGKLQEAKQVGALSKEHCSILLISCLQFQQLRFKTK